MDQIHGHEVMHLMLASGKTYTRDSLIAEIIDTFGEQARFYTCSAENMTAAEIVAFLDARGKLIRREDGFQTSPSAICQH